MNGPAFSAHFRPQRALPQHLFVAYPTSGSRSHTFHPRRSTETPWYGSPDDLPGSSMIVYSSNVTLKLQLSPVALRLGRARSSHPEDLGVTRLDRLALRLHLGRIGLQQFQAGKRDVFTLLLDLPVE